MSAQDQSGAFIILATVRVSCVLYVLALASWLLRREPLARWSWITAWLFYLAHVVAAFAYHHHWSHQAPATETARQTAEVFGFSWGEGLYFNYLFTLLWSYDALWLWLYPSSYRRRKRGTSVAIHAYIGFMFFNGAVIFASGLIRWLGLAACLLLASLAWRRNRTAQMQ